MAAESYAKVTGGLGVCLVTAGPGGTNAITGVAGAWLDSTPMLVLSGQAKRADLKGTSGVRQMGVQEVDIVSMVAPITKYAVTVMDPADIRYHMEKAVHLALTGRPGPGLDRSAARRAGATIDESSLRGFDAGRASRLEVWRRRTRLPPPAGRTIELLNAAERPVVLIGNGVRLGGARDRDAPADRAPRRAGADHVAGARHGAGRPSADGGPPRPAGAAGRELHAAELRLAARARGAAGSRRDRLRAAELRARREEDHGGRRRRRAAQDGRHH